MNHISEVLLHNPEHEPIFPTMISKLLFWSLFSMNADSFHFGDKKIKYYYKPRNYVFLSEKVEYYTIW